MTDEQQHKRRVLIAIIAAVGLIGLVGVTVALVADGDGSPGAFTTPGASFDPLSVEGKCRSEGIARFEVAPDPKAAPEFTATGAVERWVGKGETSQTTNTGDDSKLVAIGKDGDLPRVVLTVKRTDGEWAITQTAGCLEKGKSVCPSEVLTLGRTTYRRDFDGSGAVTAGKYLGTGTLTTSPADDLAGCNEPFMFPRGTIGPVSAYAAQGHPDGAVVTDDTGLRAYTD